MRMKLRYVLPLLLVTALLSSAGTYYWLQPQNPEMNKLMAVYQTLEKNYFEQPDKTKLFDGAVNGMLQALEDPYSSYMDAAEAKSFEESVSSSFVGIGAEIEEVDGKIVIVAPIKGSPAEKAGLRPGDKILKVGEVSLLGIKASEAVKHIRGEKGTKAELLIERSGESHELPVTVIRDTIPIETVFSELKDGNIGYVQVTKFSEPTADEFVKAIKDLKNKGMKGLVLDLRQNPGGLMNIALAMSEVLIPSGKTIMQVEYRGGKRDVFTSERKGAPLTEGIPTVALVDEGTASAGEILAAVLKESGGFKLIGQNTFGKGTVQTTSPFNDGSNVKYTTAKWLTPAGNWINKTGIKPDIEVKLPDYANIPFVDPDKEVKPDTFSVEVKSIQMMLQALGYAPGRTDGFFDTKTKEAVQAFQKAEGQPETGIVQGKTTRRIIELMQELIRKNDPQLEAALKEVRAAK